MSGQKDAERIMADFRVKQQQDYSFKRLYAETRAREFWEHPSINGQAYVAVGGLDSITLFLFLRSLGLDVPGVSVSTLEDASIQRVHRALGIRNLHPAIRPDGKPWTKPEIIRTFGWPIISKEVAGKIDLLQHPTAENATVRHAIITGDTGAQGGWRTGTRMQLSYRWLQLFGGSDPEGRSLGYRAAPFPVSDKCCYYLKEKPCSDYAKATGRAPYMGLMASEGGRRAKALMLHGCNYISPGTRRSCPFAIFHRSDLLRLTLEMDEWYHAHWQEFSGVHLPTIVPAIYGDIVERNGGLTTTGATRTGCSVCCFGLHMEKRPHRFDHLYRRNPKEWRFWMIDMGLGEVLDYIGVPWQPQVSLFDLINAKEDTNHDDA